MVNHQWFTIFAKVFLYQKFTLYSIVGVCEVHIVLTTNNEINLCFCTKKISICTAFAVVHKFDEGVSLFIIVKYHNVVISGISSVIVISLCHFCCQTHTILNVLSWQSYKNLLLHENLYYKCSWYATYVSASSPMPIDWVSYCRW